MNKYFALRKANRMRTKLLNEKSQEQLKDVIRYLRRVSWDFCGIELVCSDLLDISIQANAENQELFDSISDAKTFVEEVKPCLKTLRAADYFWFVAPLYSFNGCCYFLDIATFKNGRTKSRRGKRILVWSKKEF